MLTRQFRRYAHTVSILLVLVGFTLVMIGNEPVRVVGAAMLVLAIFVPFLSLGVKPDPIGWNRVEARTNPADDRRGPAPADLEGPADESASNTERPRGDDRKRTSVERASKNA